ncbi:MAG TPA: class I SAM-dependent methyltransferase [Steroidobacteraceae bacterium]|nr:class I SAM-dependent methyltransferase [Steroidobacteraceae bacterium]
MTAETSETSDKRYSDGDYLAANPTWGEEDSAWKAAKINDLWRRSGLPMPETVAEIGCGAGLILATLKSRFPDDVVYSGFDIASAAIEMARVRAGPRLSYYCEDLTKSDRRFDALLCIDVFEHVENPFEFLRTIRRLAPVVVFNIPLEMHVAGLLINHQRWTRRQYGHLHFYTAAVAFETLKECGYSVIAHDYVSRLTDLPRSASEYVFWLPRKLLSLVNKEFSARILGGTSLLVAARGGAE